MSKTTTGSTSDGRRRLQPPFSCPCDVLLRPCRLFLPTTQSPAGVGVARPTDTPQRRRTPDEVNGLH